MLKRNINLVVKLSLITITFISLALVVSIMTKAVPEEVLIQSTTPPQPLLPAHIMQPMQQIVLNSQPELYSDLKYTIYYEPEATEVHLAKVSKAIKKLESINKSRYTYKAFTVMSNELVRLREIEEQMTSDLNCYLKWEEEYYYATKVWEYFRQCGFSNETTCAIIGNMMIETSDGSLGISPIIYSPDRNYYGLCQWSQKYYPETKNMSFEDQLLYLLESMPYEFNAFGKKYKSGFKYEDFFKMTNVKEAALAFAKAYERCGPASHKMRQEAAELAYEYFNLT